MKTQPSIPHRRLTLVLWAALLCLTNPGLAVPLDQATLALQEIAKTAYPGLKPEQVVARMIADGSNPILSAKAVAQIAPPEAAPSIAAGAASVVPEAAADIAAAVAQVVPDQAVAIAAAVGKVVPAMAPQIAATVAQVVPKLAAQIAQAMGSAVPQAAGAVSTAVAGAVPGVSGLAATVSTIGVGTVAAGVAGAAAVISDNVQSTKNNASEKFTCPVIPIEISCDKEKGEGFEKTRICVGNSLWRIVYTREVKNHCTKRTVTCEGVLVDVWDCICDTVEVVWDEFLGLFEDDPPIDEQVSCPSPMVAIDCVCQCPPCESPYTSGANCACVIVDNGNTPAVQLALADPLRDNSGACASEQCTSANSTADSVCEPLRH